MGTEFDLIDAVTATNPHLHYRELVESERLSWDERHGVWVAAHPAVVREALDQPSCLVRPPGEPVPSRLVGTEAGALFGRFARMRDGEAHARAKRALALALDSVDPVALRGIVTRLIEPMARAGDLHRACFDLPVQAIASLLSIPDEALDDVREWTAALVRCTLPTATEADIERGGEAARCLRDVVSVSLRHPEATGLTSNLRRVIAEEGLGFDETVSNAIGLLFQTHDATAGLIGNTIVLLARHPERMDASPEDVVAHVARHDPPVHNTRRFVASDTEFAGQPVKAGDTIVAVLAAAGVAQPDQLWTFGYGRHACPGQSIALATATAAIDGLVRHGAIPTELPDQVPYYPMTNVRIPAFPPASKGGCP